VTSLETLHDVIAIKIRCFC